MKDILINFLKDHLDQTRPVLLALSGGPDSLALFHLLKELKVSMGIAHVDHGWREESAREAIVLKEICNGYPFHLKTLPKPYSEEVCRDERLRFYSRLCEENHYQAVILGHHQDDQVETVLKRVFEGASLIHLSGMSEVSKYEKIDLWRPLLKVTKQTILEYCEYNQLNPFYDKTNEDPKYLRAKMRGQIIPQLSELFGKEIKNSLYQLGKESQELQTFLKSHLAPYLEKVESGPFGSFLDLSENCPSSFELKYLIRKLGGSLSKEIIETAVTHILKKSANIELKNLYIDRGRLFIVSDLTQNWKMECKPAEGPLKVADWREVWKGKASFVVPYGDYKLVFPKMNLFYPRNSPISKWWTNHKIPAFLRRIVPVLEHNGLMYQELLTGKVNPEIKNVKKFLEIKLLYSC